MLNKSQRESNTLGKVKENGKIKADITGVFISGSQIKFGVFWRLLYQKGKSDDAEKRIFVFFSLVVFSSLASSKW